MNIRFATPEDFPAFAKWASENPDIPAKDIESAIRNKTTVVLVAEEDGKPILFLPFHCNITVDFFGFNPEAGAKDRYKAMQAMLPKVKKFAELHGINDIQGFSKEEYLMAKFWEKQGFEVEDRTAFVLKMPREAIHV
jgi:hypothetical protein